jgi:acylpyruvate hydrolase
LATIRCDGTTQAARIEDGQAVLLPYRDVGDLVASSPDWREAVERVRVSKTLAAAELDLAPVVTRPEKILCAGLNYRAHVLETGRALPNYPTIFAKFWRSLIGANDPIVLPEVSSGVDWEAELAIVIGRPVRHVDEDTACAAIAGYTVANDVSMRDWQTRTTEMLQGKTFEKSTPLGPHLVTPDEVGDHDLQISCSIDGTLMQSSSTSDMIFDPVTLVSYLSDIITLVPGDVILTGTPAGIGGSRKPPIYLQEGQTVTTRLTGVGELVNVCVSEAAANVTPAALAR